MTPFDVVTIGRVSVDLYAEQAGVPMSEVTSFARSIGGTATNVAIGVARLGHRAALATRVGDDDFGRTIVQTLDRRFGVDTRFVATHPVLKTPLAFAGLEDPADPSLLFYREPAAPDSELEMSPGLDEAVETASIFWVPASRFAFAKSRETVTALLERRDRAHHTVLDLDWREMFWESEAAGHEAISPVLDQVTIAIGNRKECEVAVGTGDPDGAADRLLERGLQAAIVKLGGDGVLVATADGLRERVAPYRVDVVCGLGAGDAFGAAVCHGLLMGWDLARSVRFANAAGALVAAARMCADAMPTVTELDSFIEGQTP